MYRIADILVQTHHNGIRFIMEITGITSDLLHYNVKYLNVVNENGESMFDSLIKSSPVGKISVKDAENYERVTQFKNVKLLKITQWQLEFEDGVVLYSQEQEHNDDSKLYFNDLTPEDFEGLRFDFTNHNFYRRVEGYGIELLPIKGWSVKIPAYGCNSEYTANYLTLIVTDNKDFKKTYDIDECQNIS